ncbi:MAG TPA: NUDIX hydrolase [Chloroflexota bacterium]|nr:NUDIX hydrolase [Chloroflexota bacterium]
MSTRSYCPVCGGSLELRLVAGETRERLVCPENHILYENPTVVAGTIPFSDGRVWLLRRAIEPRAGTWTFPAGYMEIGESVEDAASRETLEEICLEVEIGRLLNVYSWPETSIVFVVYLAEASGLAAAGDEALEVRAFAPSEIPWDDLAFRSTHEALKDWMLATDTSGTPAPQATG